jgi:hypothetical protein
MSQKLYFDKSDREKGFFDDIDARFAKSKNLKLALTCVPNYGHMNPMSHLAKALSERGHDVHLITVDNENKPKVEKIFENIPNVKLIFTNGPP